MSRPFAWGAIGDRRSLPKSHGRPSTRDEAPSCHIRGHRLVYDFYFQQKYDLDIVYCYKIHWILYSDTMSECKIYQINGLYIVYR